MSGPVVVREPGSLERALRDAWPGVRRRLWRQPSTWWRSWRLLRHYNLTPLRPRQVTLRIPLGVVPDCESCEEVCCTGRHRVVSLRLVDVAALLDAGLGTHITLQRPEYPVEELDENWALAEQVHSDLWKWFPVLTQDSTGTCTLLDTDLQCAAHPSWPTSCARFPYSLNVLQRTVFYAGSCHSSQLLRGDEASGRVQHLLQAALDAYNERIRDLVMVHVGGDVLRDLGLDAHLQLPRRLRPRR
ncbi:MAG: hypothetical protein ABIJ09_12955 [Pseudomonadota bacterium]